MKVKPTLMTLAAAAALCGPAQADIVTFTGTTAGGATFNRPLEDLSGLSGVGTSVAYRSVDFTVSVSGNYSFLNTARYDNFTLLYSPTFAPGSPLTNARQGSDDLLNVGTSGFGANLTANLVAGATYHYVVTGYGNTDFGSFSATVGGPGDILLGATSQTPTDIFTATGTTAGAPTFNRPLEGLGGLSGIGTAVAYHAMQFYVDITGEYNIMTTGMFDTFGLLYEGIFDPLSPLNGAVESDDDLVNARTSGFATNLIGGKIYTYVVTGFGNGDFGAFSTTIAGAGHVPEPPTYALMLLGLSAAGGLARRRRLGKGPGRSASGAATIAC